mmetsp:Transcript_74482/g.125476  ORF Transcript_74482/g.125476 Transcript_74482/m.125476 type:complete len:318 (+) Transcript_74482:190-1143(+)
MFVQITFVGVGDGFMLLSDLCQSQLHLLDGAVLGVQHVLQFPLHRPQCARLQVTGLQNLPQLCILLLQLPGQHLHLLGQQHVLEHRLLLQLVQHRLVPLIQLVSLLMDLVVALLQHLVLPGQRLELVLQQQQALLRVLEGLLVLLIVRQLVAQEVDLLQGFGQGLREALVLLRNLEHQLFVVGLIALHVAHLLLEILDQFQIVGGDVIVVLPDVLEGLVVLRHQLLDVLRLAALNVIDLRLPLQFHFLAEVLDALLILHLHLLDVALKALHLQRQLLVVILPHAVDLFVMLQLLTVLLFLQITFVALQVRLLFPVLL